MISTPRLRYPITTAWILDPELLHQGKMAALLPRIFGLRFFTTGGSGDICFPSLHTVSCLRLTKGMFKSQIGQSVGSQVGVKLQY